MYKDITMDVDSHAHLTGVTLDWAPDLLESGI
jgi:hypothetical protein